MQDCAFVLRSLFAAFAIFSLILRAFPNHPENLALGPRWVKKHFSRVTNFPRGHFFRPLSPTSFSEGPVSGRPLFPRGQQKIILLGWGWWELFSAVEKRPRTLQKDAPTVEKNMFEWTERKQRNIFARISNDQEAAIASKYLVLQEMYSEWILTRSDLTIPTCMRQSAHLHIHQRINICIIAASCITHHAPDHASSYLFIPHQHHSLSTPPTLIHITPSHPMTPTSPPCREIMCYLILCSSCSRRRVITVFSCAFAEPCRSS